MKFGKLLKRRAIVAWASYYVDYKLLKNIIKELQQGNVRFPTEEDEIKNHKDLTKFYSFGKFFFALALEAEKVDKFYIVQVQLLKQELTPVIEKINKQLSETKEPIAQAMVQQLGVLCQRLDTMRGILFYIIFILFYFILIRILLFTSFLRIVYFSN